jgi:hypothetical protein
MGSAVKPPLSGGPKSIVLKVLPVLTRDKPAERIVPHSYIYFFSCIRDKDGQGNNRA